MDSLGVGHSGLKQHILQLVAANDVDAIPDDLPDDMRFFAGASRAAAHPGRSPQISVFVYSESARTDAGASANRVAHISDGHDDISEKIVFSGRDVHNGWAIDRPTGALSATFDALAAAGLGARPTVVWDGHNRKAGFYPNGVDGGQESFLTIPLLTNAVTQDDVCAVLNELYNEGMKTPSGHTVKVWVAGKVKAKLEEEIERYLKATVQARFSGHVQKVKILAQTNTPAGRTDLILLQRSPTTAGPVLTGVLELKILRGVKDAAVTLEGLQQGHAYRHELGLPFATLVLYDVGKHKTHDATPLLKGVEQNLITAVRVRRFPLFQDPQSWRQAGSFVA